MNQWPERDDATLDERLRLDEESRFGGVRVGKNEFRYADGDSVYFVHNFANNMFYSPEEWAELRSNFSNLGPQVVVIDLNGHFVVAVACHIRQAGRTSDTTDLSTHLESAMSCSLGVEGEAKVGSEIAAIHEPEAAGTPTLVIFNTTTTNYLNNPSVAFTFDTFL